MMGPGAGEPDDAVLLRAVARRDEAALATLYDRHAGWLTVRLTRRCALPDVVDMAVRDTFLALRIVVLPRARSTSAVAIQLGGSRILSFGEQDRVTAMGRTLPWPARPDLRMTMHRGASGCVVQHSPVERDIGISEISGVSGRIGLAGITGVLCRMRRLALLVGRFQDLDDLRSRPCGQTDTLVPLGPAAVSTGTPPNRDHEPPLWSMISSSHDCLNRIPNWHFCERASPSWVGSEVASAWRLPPSR